MKKKLTARDLQIVIDREAREIMHLVASVCLSVRPSVCPFVRALMAEPFRGSALPSAAKSKKSHYQFKLFVCVSVISGRMRIISQMRSIGVLMLLVLAIIVRQFFLPRLLRQKEYTPSTGKNYFAASGPLT